MALKGRQSLSDGRFDRLAIPLYLTHEHRALYCGDAKIRHLVLVGVLGESSFRFLFDEERGYLVLYNFEDKAEVPTNQLIVFCNFVANCSERTATSHAESPLQRDLREEPLFQILPGLDLIFEGRGACSDRVQVTLKHLVHKALLALEIVIKLALPG